jgi:hypothetical protein
MKKASWLIMISTGGFTLITFWKRLSMVSSQKAGAMLLILLDLHEMKLIHPD